MRTPREILELLHRFHEEETFASLPEISKDELRAFIAEARELTDEPYLGVHAEHWYSDAAMLAFIHDEQTFDEFWKLTRYYE